MSEEGTQPDTTTGDDTATTEPTHAENLGKALKAARGENGALKARIAELEAAEAERERAAAEEAGEFKRLYEEATAKVSTLTETVSAFEARETARVEALTARNSERIKALPEQLQTLVPEGLDADATATWLDRAAQLPAESARGGFRGTGKTASEEIPQECVEEAKKYGKDPKQWFETHRARFTKKTA